MASNILPVVWNENNQVKWVGIRPGYTGDHLTADGLVANGVVDIYTVPANKILLLFNSEVALAVNGAGAFYAFLNIYNAVPAIIHICNRVIGAGATATGQSNVVRFVPYPLPAGYKIELSCIGVPTYGAADIEGILVDA